MKKPLQLFLTFFKIGAFTLGGGYAMLSMVEKAVVDQKKWIPNDEFWDMIAVVQSLPAVTPFQACPVFSKLPISL